MEIYRLEMERMEKQHEQHDDKQDCHHHELTMLLMMMVSDRDTNSLNYATNNPTVLPFTAKKSPRVPKSISYSTNDDSRKEHDERDNDEDKEECKNNNNKDKSDELM
eukprot:12152173-Ditylum_brightwellii.AAC.1